MVVTPSLVSREREASPLTAQTPASPLPLPMVLDMTVTSGPTPTIDQLIPISVDEATQSHQQVNYNSKLVYSLILFRITLHKKQKALRRVLRKMLSVR